MIYRVSHTSGIINGEIALPSSKSISNRLLIIKHIGGLKLELRNLSSAKDTAILLQSLDRINTEKIVDVGHAGTAMRFLTALFAVVEGGRILTGSERMKQRPVAELVNSLRSLGAEIEYLEKDGFPPMRVIGKKLKGGKVKLNAGISSQYISALLMIAPLLSGALEIEFEGEPVSKPYIDMTIALMKEYGADVQWKNKTLYASNKSYTTNKEFAVIEADWSSASYLYAIAALAKEAGLTIKGLQQKSLQADAACIVLFERLGINSRFNESGELVLTKMPVTQGTVDIDFTSCPDIAQTIAVVMAGKGMSGILSGLKTLTIKETDRIAAIHNELKKFNVETVVTPESIAFRSPVLLPATEPVECYHDHRMALAFAPLSLVTPTVEIIDPMVVEKSYPGYWEHLGQLGFTVEEVSS